MPDSCLVLTNLNLFYCTEKLSTHKLDRQLFDILWAAWVVHLFDILNSWQQNHPFIDGKYELLVQKKGHILSPFIQNPQCKYLRPLFEYLTGE
jgi:hypothetical protein